jgi:hypothetical protein
MKEQISSLATLLNEQAPLLNRPPADFLVAQMCVDYCSTCIYSRALHVIGGFQPMFSGSSHLKSLGMVFKKLAVLCNQPGIA